MPNTRFSIAGWSFCRCVGWLGCFLEQSLARQLHAVLIVDRDEQDIGAADGLGRRQSDRSAPHAEKKEPGPGKHARRSRASVPKAIPSLASLLLFSPTIWT